VGDGELILYRMPGIVHNTGSSIKRKREGTDKRPLKRSRSESSDEDEQAQILLLENEIFESKKNYNNIAKLISLLRDEGEDPEISVVAAISLCRVFTRLMVAGDMNKKRSSPEKDIVVIRWLKERYTEYKITLLSLLGEEDVDTTALTLCMRLLKTEGQHLQSGQDHGFPIQFLREIVQVLLKPGNDGSARKEFGEKYAEDYDDIRFYAFEALE
jgi:U3 small nucleolar RNA-associated protein 19